MKEELKIYESPVVEVVLIDGLAQVECLTSSPDVGDGWDWGDGEW